MNPLRTLAGSPWMIREDVFRAMVRAASREIPQGLARRLSVAPTKDDAPPKPYRVDRGVAVIDVFGPIYRHSTAMDDCMAAIFGGVSIDAIRSALRAAVADEAAVAWMLNVSSPGGEAAGLHEMADEIRAALSSKPGATYAESYMCSAAYYLGCAAGEITVGPAALVGSIGTIICTYDDTAFQEQIGIKDLIIRSSQSPRKAPDVATEEGLSEYQRIVDDTAAVFVADVARLRGISEATVLADYGQGAALIAAEALKNGMVDKIGTYDDVIRKLSGRNRARLAVSRPAATTQGTAAPLRLRLRPR